MNCLLNRIQRMNERRLNSHPFSPNNSLNQPTPPPSFPFPFPTNTSKQSIPSFLPLASRQRLHLQMQRLPQHIRLRRHLPRLIIEHLRRAGLSLLRHLLSTRLLVPTRSADFCRYHFRLAQSNTHPLLCSCLAATYWM